MADGWTAQQIESPIVAWQGGMSWDVSKWPAMFQQLKEQGFNILGGVGYPISESDWWKRLATTAEEYEMGIMPWAGQAQEKFLPGWEISPEWEDWLSMMSGRPSLYGFYAWEEPNVIRQGGGWPELGAMTDVYETIKRLAPEAKVTGTLGLAEPQYAENYPEIMDVIYPEFYYGAGEDTLEEWAARYERIWEPMLSQFEGEVYPFVKPAVFGDVSLEEIMSGWESITGEPATGLGYYSTVMGLPEETMQQIIAYNELLGGPYIPPTDGTEIPSDDEGGETMPTTFEEWLQYNLYPPPPYGLSGEAGAIPPSVERFPWTRAYYPQATGYGGQEWPSVPLYRPFGAAPPGFEAERYLGMDVPGTFFEGVPPATLEAYKAGQLGDYPVYGGYEDELGVEARDVIGQMLRGEGVGIPEEAIQYQQAMGRITAAERVGHEELTKQLERAGRTGMGLAPAEHAELTQTMAGERVGVAQEFAIKTAEMQQEAKMAAIPMALAQQQFGREGTVLVQESRERAWGAETSDLFQEYASKLEVATTDYDMRTAQNEMIQAGQERAWGAAQEEYTKVYQSAKEAGKDEYDAERDGWEAALRQYEMLFESIRTAALQELAIVMQARQWSEARYLAAKGVQAARPGFWDYIGMALGGFAGGYGAGLA